MILNNKSVKGSDTLFELTHVTIAQSKNLRKLELQRVTHPIYDGEIDVVILYREKLRTKYFLGLIADVVVKLRSNVMDKFWRQKLC